MPTRHHVAHAANATHPAPARLSLIAGLACTLALAFSTSAALAQPTLERVEINGRVIDGPVRYDVREHCARVDVQMQDQLESSWFHEPSAGEVDVVFAVTDGKVQAVRARGASFHQALDVRRAVRRLDCSGSGSGTSVYRMQVEFVDPAYPPATRRVASAGEPPLFVISASR